MKRLAILACATFALVCQFATTPLAADTLVPAVVTNCKWQFLDPANDNYDIAVGVTFQNAGTQTINAVKFVFIGLDAFGEPILNDSGIVTGTFSPGAVIAPKPLRGLFGMSNVNGAWVSNRDDSGSSAFELPNTYGTKVQRVECITLEVRLSDGTTWKNSALSE